MPTSFVLEVADLGYLERHGMAGDALQRMAALHTGVTGAGAVAEGAEVREPSLNHCLPAGQDAISPARGSGVPKTASAGNPSRAATACGRRSPPAAMTICPTVLLTAKTVQIGPPDGYF
jgi:hypothetical protein